MNMVTIKLGSEGIMDAYTIACSYEKIDVVCLSHNYDAVLGDSFDTVIAQMLSERSTREIVPDTPDNRAYALKKGMKNETRFMSAEAESDVILVKDAVILISYELKNPFAIIIKDSGIISNLRIQFEELWSQLA